MFFFSMSINDIMSTPLIWQDSMSLAKSNPAKPQSLSFGFDLLSDIFLSFIGCWCGLGFEAALTVAMLPACRVGAIGAGRPSASSATNVKMPSVTLTRSPSRLRSAQASRRIATDVRPTRSTAA